MSGGSHDYIYSRIREAADMIKDVAADQAKSEYGSDPRPITKEEKKLVKLLRALSDVYYELEWWRSGDTGKADFIRSFKKFSKKWLK